METVTIETLLADEDLYDLLMEIVARKQEKPQDLIVAFIELANTRSVIETVGWMRQLLCTYRIQFDPSGIAVLPEFDGRVGPIAMDEEPGREEGEERVALKIACIEIARTFGRDAAMLYKLSDGAIDPRGDA